MNEVFNAKNWRVAKEQFEEECKNWLLLLMGLVTKNDVDPELTLHEFLSSQYVVAKHHQGFIVDQVCCIPMYKCNIMQTEVSTGSYYHY